MKNRMALKIALAFCAALGIGRLLCGYLPTSSTPIPPEAVAQSTVATVATSESPALLAAANAPAPFYPDVELAREQSRALAERPIERNLRAVSGGVENDNIKMSHFMAADVTEGSLHKVKDKFDATIRWLPQTQQLRRGNETAAVLAPVAASHAKVEKLGNLDVCVYNNSYPETDEHMYTRADGGFEHDFILKQSPLALDESQDLAYTGYLQLSKGLTLWDGKKQITGSYTAKNDVHIKNAFGNTVFVLLRAKAFDAAVTNADGSFNAEKQAEPQYRRCFTGCAYHFDFDDSGIKLAIVTPGKWLKDSSRTYPVTIDPPYGPWGMMDGDPPVYVGEVGSATIIPAEDRNARVDDQTLPPMGVRTRMQILGTAAGTWCDKADNGWGMIIMPFPFTTYYNMCTHPRLDQLCVHIDGFAHLDVNDSCMTHRSAGHPAPLLCFDTPNTAIPTLAYPTNPSTGFFAYWDDLKFGPAATGNDPASAIYFFWEGTAPNRKLVIEWYKMQFVHSVNTTNTFTFNLILYECDSVIQYILGRQNEQDPGNASVGIEGLDVRTGIYKGIQYTYNAVPQGYPAITPGTSVWFRNAKTAGVTVTPLAPPGGCAPYEVCFRATAAPPNLACQGPPRPQSYEYHWDFGDGTEAFTPNVCHTWAMPGTYQVSFRVRDEFHTSTTLPAIPVNVCHSPDVVIGATPQGGPAPLMVVLEARTPNDTNVTTNAANWVIEKLGLNNEPGQVTQIASFTGNIINYRFDEPGLYRVRAIYNGQDNVANMPVSSTGTIFIFVTDPQRVIEDSMVITQSQFNINWKSKIPPPNPQGVVPAPLPLNPNVDTLTIKGIINLPGISTSDLMGRYVRVIINGVNPVFDSIFNAAGVAVQGDETTGQTGIFKIAQPSGSFICSVKGNLYGALGLTNYTEKRLHAVHFRIEIEGLFPPPSSLGPIVTYDYKSKQYKSAVGVYKFGRWTKNNPAKSGKYYNPTAGPDIDGYPDIATGTSKTGGLETLVSGCFQVINANLKLEGATVYAQMSGLLARSGGDGLRPTANSDVVVSLGNFSEALNFSSTPVFKTTGKPPKQKFSFKRSSGLGTTGVATMQWVNRAGRFSIKTFGLPNEQVGLNPLLSVQALVLKLTITPDSGVVFSGSTRFEVSKKSETQFTRVGKE